MEKRKPLTAIISEDADPLTKQAFYQTIRENGPENFNIIVKPARKEQPMPTKEFVSRLSPEYIKNMQWLMQNPNELAGYEGQFVVIANQQIYCSGESREAVEKIISEDNIPRKDIVIERIDDLYATYLN